MLPAVLFSCKAKSSHTIATADGSDVAGSSTAAGENMIGSYVGSFGDNKITVLISKVSGDSVEGRSVVGGNDRPFSGTVKESDGVYQLVAKEPGSDAHDGTFQINFNPKQTDEVTGSWEPFQPTEKIKGKSFTLNRKAFEYRKDVGNFPQGSQRILTEDDVNNLSKSDLELMRNEIFARHGYCFKKKDYRQQFESEEWYVPNTAEIKNLLTDIEKKNIALIKRFEKYAEEYGDEYGR